jgi:hypothetical protein
MRAARAWLLPRDAPSCLLNATNSESADNSRRHTLRAANSEKYRAHRFLHDLDGPGKRCYDGAGEMQYADMRMSSGRMSSSAQLRRVACIVLLSDSWSV